MPQHDTTSITWMIPTVSVGHACSGQESRRSNNALKVNALESGGGGNRTRPTGDGEGEESSSDGTMSKLPAPPVVSRHLVPQGHRRDTSHRSWCRDLTMMAACFDGGDVAERMSGFWWESADRPTAPHCLDARALSARPPS